MTTIAEHTAFMATLDQTYLSLLSRSEQDAARFHEFTAQYASEVNTGGLDRLFRNLRKYFPEIVEQISLVFIKEMARLSQGIQPQPLQRAAPASLEELRDVLNRVQTRIPGYTPPPRGYRPPEDIHKAIQTHAQRLLSILTDVLHSPEGSPLLAEAIDVKSEVVRLIDIQKKRQGRAVPHPEMSPFLPITVSLASRWQRMPRAPILQIPAYLYLTPHFLGTPEDQNWAIKQGSVVIKDSSGWTKTLQFVERSMLAKPLQTQSPEWLITVIKLLPTFITGNNDALRKEESILPFHNAPILDEKIDLSLYPPEIKQDLTEAISLRDRWGNFEAAVSYFTDRHWESFKKLGYVPPSPDRVEPLLKEFIAYMQRMMGDTRFHPYQIASLIHYGIALIHPFEKANGCMARLLANIYLMQQGIPPICFFSADHYLLTSTLRDEAFEMQFGDLIAESLNRTIGALQINVFPKGPPIFRPF